MMPLLELVKRTQMRLMEVYDATRLDLRGLDEPSLTELVHGAEDIRNRTAGSERLAAEILSVEAQVLLDKRKQTTTKGTV